MTADRCFELKCTAASAHVVAGTATVIAALAQVSADSGSEVALKDFVGVAELQMIHDLLGSVIEAVSRDA